MEDQLIALGVKFAEVVSRNSISFVGDRINLAKEKKNLESQSLAYTEIINNLLQDKEELALIAREYKQAYEQITISDEDIEYLHNTLEGAIELLDAFSPQSEGTKMSMRTIVDLLSKDTLKTMQLIGFNYKEAIGQPLTEACSNAIKTKLKVDLKQKPNYKK